MTSLIGLFEATAVAFGVLLCFAFLRRVMRMTHPPAVMDNAVAGFAISLLFTVSFMGSLMFLGFQVFPVTGSVALAGVVAIVMHIVLWICARLIVPISEASAEAEQAVAGHNPLNGDGLATH